MDNKIDVIESIDEVFELAKKYNINPTLLSNWQKTLIRDFFIKELMKVVNSNEPKIALLECIEKLYS